ncbi:capsular polysaccharide export protein [Rhodovulum iodosum]|uniref:Capsular polysaccharide export protein n=1 Tax=Rhodovulum iodosum TaxID=68291 RepID=A0ABV3XNK9_9RHOB|nr:capsule biosynthesis protein CapA [Rhodovulum robiginosum]RSK34787.1 capsule biosynthesis protein CapA [Rhodovulum robiginosum]
MLGRAGAEAWRVGFNLGDQVLWGDRRRYIPFTGTVQDWPATCAEIMDARAITDLVLYGDTRPVHAAAIAIARARGLRVHVFEEGYLRPYWVTYERDGANGHSRLMELSVDEMRAALYAPGGPAIAAPAHWGDMRAHMFYGALYHGLVMLPTRRYRRFRPHRGVSIGREFRLHLRRLLLMPAHAVGRLAATARITRSGFPYHLVLLQLEHDASFRCHSPFSSMADFLALCMEGFAAGAPPHHHLVLKAHPLEDGRSPVRAEVARLARAHGLADRVHFVRGGKLATLLDQATSAVTVNSTAGQQVLWRGLPLRAFGRAVYSKPEFVSDQPLDAFFAAPRRPDRAAYADFRRFLLESSQIPGGFYSTDGRRQAMRRVVDLMLAEAGPYAALDAPGAAHRQQLYAVECGA